MSFTIAFYIHHHGSGHLMRTLQIVKALKNHQVILMGSGLKALTELPSNIKVAHLPLDIADENENTSVGNIKSMAFHYAPIGIKGIRNRVALMTEVFQKNYPLILVIDVSVEVALLARLAGIPTIIMRQHGNRTDLPHQLAYDSAELLIAPFSNEMYVGEKDNAYKKTVFTGGFSRFDSVENNVNINQNTVCILVGNGGTSITEMFIKSIALSCNKFHFKVLGLEQNKSNRLANLEFLGQVVNPAETIKEANIIIGNTGHNTVMEAASLNKRFVGIPENRPFDEQIEKAKSIQNRAGIKIVSPNELLKTDWLLLLENIKGEQVDWKGVIAPKAVEILAETIVKTGEKLFKIN
ncbi:glycosyltransferase [Pedobacter lithocola]|uniref:Glycosyltransferase n=1 Tax=Pedobacter lithocola TaxID=1908239 RepID=A0ABV8P8G4_9SPHI